MSEKSDEITAIPLLLRCLDVQGALVTIDAMGTQKEIDQTIINGGGDYVLALKENWLATYAEVEKVFADPPPTLTLERCETIDGDHGRIETRCHTVCHTVDWLFSDLQRDNLDESRIASSRNAPEAPAIASAECSHCLMPFCLKDKIFTRPACC